MKESKDKDGGLCGTSISVNNKDIDVNKYYGK